MSANNHPALNERQYQLVLQHIASQADIIAKLAFRSAERLSETDEDMVLFGLASMARQIGSLADEASGGVFRGGTLEWECGHPVFYAKDGAS